MLGKRDRAVLVVSILVIALAVAGGWWSGALRPDTRPALTSAIDVLPASTTIVGFTDWAQIRETLELGTVDTAGERDELTDESAIRDLSTRSVIAEAGAMHEVLGWSAAEVDWEAYGQDRNGAAAVVRLDGSVSYDAIRSRLREAGYTQDGQVWSSTKRTGLPDIMAHVGFVPRQRLIVMSDTKARIPLMLDVAAGRARSLAGNQAAADTARVLAGSETVLMQGGTLGCETSAVGGGADKEQQARTAVERAGGLEPYLFSGRGLVDRGGSGFSAQRLVFAMTFESAAVASEQARVRERLAAGPFIGRFGQLEETVRLQTSASDGPTLQMAFAHDPETDVFMTGLGPVLFATCKV